MVGMISILIFLAVARTSVAEDAQVPLASSLRSDAFQSGNYKFEWPIHKIAIIGAGPAGLIAYREFSQEGYDVHVFERDDSPGGNWHYTDETPLSCPVPNVDIALADFIPSLPPKGAKLPYIEEYQNEQGEEIRRDHRAPKPIWASLKSNTPAPIMQFTEFPWPRGTPWELPQQKLQNYLRAFASWHGINTNDGNSHIHYNTRVESVQKRYAEDGSRTRTGWVLTVKELVKTSSNTTRATWTTENFDAVVVAAGKHNAPNIPNIEGLAEWAKRFPDRISHSREYRRPDPFSNQTVLVIGAATSGVEISRDIIRNVRKEYLSYRPDRSTVSSYDMGTIRNRLPPNVTLVSEIKRFLPVGSLFNEGQIELVDGTIISGLDHIIFATGFRYSFPFLSQYHNSSIGLNDTAPRGSPQPIITDGSHARALYMDTFYIDDPTLAFVDVNSGPYYFTYPEYLSLAIAKVWAGKADLPCTAELWRRYDKVVEDRGGYGKKIQFLDRKAMKGKFSYNVPQLEYGFSEAGSTLMLSNMVGGRLMAFPTLMRLKRSGVKRNFLDPPTAH